MKQFLKRDGTTTDRLPRPEDYIEDDPKRTVSQTYAVQLLDEDLKVVATEFLFTQNYPKAPVLKWCLMKHRSEGAVYASVRKLHALTFTGGE